MRDDRATTAIAEALFTLRRFFLLHVCGVCCRDLPGRTSERLSGVRREPWLLAKKSI